MQQLQAEGGQLHRRDNNMQNAVYYAVRHVRARLVNYLVREGLELNENDYVMQTPLFYSAKYDPGV